MVNESFEREHFRNGINLGHEVNMLEGALMGLSRMTSSVEDLRTLNYVLSKNCNELLSLFRENNLEYLQNQLFQQIQWAQVYLIRNTKMILKENPHLLRSRIRGNDGEHLLDLRKILFEEVIPYLKKEKKMKEVEEIEKMIDDGLKKI